MTVYDFKQYDMGYYATSIGAGAIGTCITHTAMTVSFSKSVLRPAGEGAKFSLHYLSLSHTPSRCFVCLIYQFSRST